MSDLKTELPDAEDNWTFYDDDPSVAWDVEESYHAKVGMVYSAAGWQRCYHRDGAKWHYNVKVGGAWRETREAIHKIVDEYGLDLEDVERRFNTRNEMDLEWWWELDGDYLLNGDDQSMVLGRRDYWSGGRSSGWFCVKESYSRHNPEEMLELAEFLRGSVEYYNSAHYVKDLSEMVEMDIQDEMKAEANRRKRAFDMADDIQGDVPQIAAALLGELRA